MKKSLILTLATSIALAIFGTTAYAGITTDKEELGKFERQGQFLKPVLTASPRGDSDLEMASVKPGTHPVVDKGELGQYERHGRTLRAVRDIGPANRGEARVANASSSVKHDHGLNNKEHKNVRN